VAIIPARIASTRLARKMLLAETGRCLFEHTVRNVADAGVVDRIVVATDDEDIARAARRAEIDVVMTRKDHASGTDRVHEAVAGLASGPYDVVVNVQGDEPELAHSDLAALVDAFHDVEVQVATLAGPLSSEAEVAAPHVVKVVCDAHGDALYFSRLPIPSRSHAKRDAEAGLTPFRRHLGVYAFRPAALTRFCSLPLGRLEALENLEQLRWLEAGLRMRVVPARSVPLGIDTRADYDAFAAREAARRAAAPPPLPHSPSSSSSSSPSAPTPPTQSARSGI
jgi:3-deoxy-manno-octulosonate cytidylyltransferase (CMP-KDO synthetase)